MSKAATVCVLIGVVLIGASVYWTSPIGPSVSWSEEQARKLASAGSEVHRLGNRSHAGSNHHSASRSIENPNSEYQKAKQAYDKYQRAFATAKARHKRIATVLKWSGITLTAIGIYGLFATKHDH